MHVEVDLVCRDKKVVMCIVRNPMQVSSVCLPNLLLLCNVISVCSLISIGVVCVFCSEIISSTLKKCCFKAGGDEYGTVSVGSKECNLLINGNATCLSVHDMTDFDKEENIDDQVSQIVEIKNVVWDDFYKNAHVFVALHRGAKVSIEIFK